MRMRSVPKLLAIAILVTTGESHALFEPGEKLSQAEVRELFSDKTVESYNLNTWRTSFTYYHPNGRLSQERLWRKRTGQWTVTEEGKVCIKFKEYKCRDIIRRDGKYYKTLPDKKGKPRLLIRYRHFSNGNALAQD